MEKYKASENFEIKKAQVLANVQKSDESYALYLNFSQESYEEGFNRGC